MTVPYLPLQLLLTHRTNREWQWIWGSNDQLASHFQDCCLNLAAHLRHVPAQRVILFNLDRRHFLAGLLSSLQAGKEIFIPHCDASGLRNELVQPDDLILDTLYIEEHSKISEPSCKAGAQGSISLYTSGTTGIAKIVRKKISQLDNEISTLESLWGECIKQPVFFSTVPHHHIYGLLFSLLWPACAGYRIAHETFAFWETLENRYCSRDYLISSPAHLSRLPYNQESLIPFGKIFSSGAPLAFNHAKKVKRSFGFWPIEVYGSTETGGIAYREQTQEHQPWTPFPHVEITQGENQRLRIVSPHLPDDQPFETEDQISLVHPAQFHLLGRTDRIVKVEGKRVSLTEIENRALDTHYIQEAIAILLASSHRNEIGVVACLNSHGQDQLRALGKNDLVRHLRQCMAPYLDQVALPRRWRFVDSIPVDNRGKRPLALMKELFEMTDSTDQKNSIFPEVISSTQSGQTAELVLRIPATLSYLKGHFPGLPIVPGVVQLHWAVAYAKDFFDLSGIVLGGSQIKFSQLMQPDHDVQLILEHSPELQLVVYRYMNADTCYSSGRFTYAV